MARRAVQKLLQPVKREKLVNTACAHTGLLEVKLPMALKTLF